MNCLGIYSFRNRKLKIHTFQPPCFNFRKTVYSTHNHLSLHRFFQSLLIVYPGPLYSSHMFELQFFQHPLSDYSGTIDYNVLSSDQLRIFPQQQFQLQ